MPNKRSCVIPHCHSEDYDIVYLGYPLCDRCWAKYADDMVKLKELLNKIKVVPDGQEGGILLASKETPKKEDANERNE